MAVDVDYPDVPSFQALGSVLVDAVRALAAQARSRLGAHVDLRRGLDLDGARGRAAGLDARQALAGERKLRIEADARAVFEVGHGFRSRGAVHSGST
jgi:hypothetical protein